MTSPFSELRDLWRSAVEEASGLLSGRLKGRRSTIMVVSGLRGSGVSSVLGALGQSTDGILIKATPGRLVLPAVAAGLLPSEITSKPDWLSLTLDYMARKADISTVLVIDQAHLINVKELNLLLGGVLARSFGGMSLILGGLPSLSGRIAGFPGRVESDHLALELEAPTPSALAGVVRLAGLPPSSLQHCRSLSMAATSIQHLRSGGSADELRAVVEARHYWSVIESLSATEAAYLHAVANNTGDLRSKPHSRTRASLLAQGLIYPSANGTLHLAVPGMRQWIVDHPKAVIV